jgi:hypothetical protein
MNARLRIRKSSCNEMTVRPSDFPNFPWYPQFVAEPNLDKSDKP